MHGHKIIHENSNSIQTVNNLISLHRFFIKALYHLDLLYICVLNRVCKPSLRDILAILYYTRYVLRLSSFLSNWAINMFTFAPVHDSNGGPHLRSRHHGIHNTPDQMFIGQRHTEKLVLLTKQ